METVEKGAVQFNLGSKQLEIIGLLLTRAADHQSHQEYRELLSCFNSMRGLIISRLSQSERKELFEIGSKASQCFAMMSTGIEDRNEKKNAELYGIAISLINKYQIRLMDLLEEKGFLVPTMPDNTNIFGQDPDEN